MQDNESNLIVESHKMSVIKSLFKVSIVYKSIENDIPTTKLSGTLYLCVNSVCCYPKNQTCGNFKYFNLFHVYPQYIYYNSKLLIYSVYCPLC